MCLLSHQTHGRVVAIVVCTHSTVYTCMYILERMLQRVIFVCVRTYVRAYVNAIDQYCPPKRRRVHYCGTSVHIRTGGPDMIENQFRGDQTLAGQVETDLGVPQFSLCNS